MTAAEWHGLLLVAYLVASVAAFTTLTFFTKAAYGCHDSITGGTKRRFPTTRRSAAP